MNEQSSTVRTALVTGASRGIGQAIAQRLAKDGFRVVGTATSEKGAQAIDEMLGNAGRGVVLDVSDADSIARVFENLKDNEGGVEVLVNNAGITADGLLLRMKDEDWDRIIETNLSGIFRLCRGVLRAMMKARYGRIIQIGSVIGSMGNPGQANYAAAKAGLVGFSKSLAREVGSRGITVNVVAPGFIATAMTDALDEQQQARLREQIPAGRLGSTEDVAAAVAFLASTEAGYITGETLHINGGMLMS